ncbi:hypothetical protein [Desulforhopalus singaporensis]|uniref:Uncharacterized protein n=1 Tax=Desulforhopalus singaporensis TaxID=91360 RepID=A0A1H0UB88_9BACT|nr:hypothetical protein [Desulforhopalus singaporensis]SDP63572.1 hypothetical protein SAMN05660330_03480 [Desulforhopalus singaporensis]
MSDNPLLSEISTAVPNHSQSCAISTSGGTRIKTPDHNYVIITRNRNNSWVDDLDTFHKLNQLHRVFN